jgi:hypothetical protein
VLSWIRADGFGSGEGCLIKCGAQRMEMEFVTSGGFATGILRITALYFLGMRRLDFESPQQKPLDGEAFALIANPSQRNPGIENRGGRKRLSRRRCPQGLSGNT